MRVTVTGGHLEGMRPLLGSAADPLHPSSLTLLAGLKPSNPKLQRAVWQDLMREDDARQMDALIAKLDSMRTQQAPETRPVKPQRKEQSGGCRKQPVNGHRFVVCTLSRNLIGQAFQYHCAAWFVTLVYCFCCYCCQRVHHGVSRTPSSV